MEHNDILENQFKKAAENVAQSAFPSMENVWNKIEDKLDTKVLKKETKLWKKIAVAASILLCISIGYQFFKSNNEIVIPANEVVVNEKPYIISDTISSINNSISTLSNPNIKENIDAIIANKSKSEAAVAINENDNQSEIVQQFEEKEKSKESEVDPETPPIVLGKKSSNFIKPKVYDAVSVKSIYQEVGNKNDDNVNKIESVKKQDPLWVIDGEAVANNKSADAKDKLKSEDIENIIVLKEPLYIINGVQYSENELFGGNPTSPYAPLEQQEIIKTTILQNEEATEYYGEKGKKGVIIITTKTGKPIKKTSKN
jgi:hypothetical protein